MSGFHHGVSRTALSIAGLQRSRSTAARKPPASNGVLARREAATRSRRVRSRALGALRHLRGARSTPRPARGAAASSTSSRCLFGIEDRLVGFDASRRARATSPPSSKNRISLRSTRSTARPRRRSVDSAVYASLSGIFRAIATRDWSSQASAFDEAVEENRSRPTARARRSPCGGRVEVVEVPAVALGVRHDGEHVAFAVHQAGATERRPLASAAASTLPSASA